MAGTVVEWYEFFLYGTAATLVFSKYFFPARATSSTRSSRRSSPTPSASPPGPRRHRVRPLRRQARPQEAAAVQPPPRRCRDLPDGLPPDLRQIGYCAPALLVALRFIQGFAIGGEWGGAVLLVAEHSPDDKRGFWASWPQAGVPVGNLLATARPARPDLDAVRRGVPELGLARGVLAVRRDRARRLLHPHHGHRGADLPRGAEAGRGDQGRVATASSRCCAAIPGASCTAMGLRFAENIMYYLVVTFSITYLSVVVETDTDDILWLMLHRARRALPRDPAGRPAVRPHRPHARRTSSAPCSPAPGASSPSR